MNKEQILISLKRIAPSAKLPTQIDFKISDNCLFILVSERGVVANMQEDKSAFEGWAIVIKAAIPEVKRVLLDWEDPKYNTKKENAQKAHYNRFIMRVANFKWGYAWFDIAERRKVSVNAMQNLLNSRTLVINFPKSECQSKVDKEKKPEAYLERELVKQWSKSIPITDEQLPVGIFSSGVVCIANTFTPRGASQIDLWQLHDKTMNIYELKVKGNESVGIISELMFYVCTVQNIVNGLIKIPDISKAKSYRHFKDFAKAVTSGDIKAVVGYLTAVNFHPLIESHQLKSPIKNILNDNALGVSFEYKDISDIKL